LFCFCALIEDSAMADDFSLGAIFAELAPTRQKWLRAMRVASVTALGAGVMATMQIANPFGLTMLVNLSLPEAAFPLTRGIIFLFCAAVFQTLAVAVAAALANSPALQLTVFIVLSLVTSYLIYAVPILGRLWLWIQVPVVTAFYMVLFMPDELVWDNAQMFVGMVIAVGLLLLFNNMIWPEAVQTVLANSLVETIERSRSRFTRLIAIAVGDATPDEDRPVSSQLGHHVALLGQIHEMSKPGQLGRMLMAVMSAERVHTQIDRFASIVLEEPGAFSKSKLAAELRALAGALNELFDFLISNIRQQLAEPASAADGLSPLVTPIDLSASLMQVARDYPELAQLAGALAALAALLEDNALESPKDEDTIADDPPRSSRGADPFLVRFAVRHTLALTIAFLLGLWDNSAALHAAIWLLMLGGPPSHGGTPRKFMMRALGSSGALALAALGTIVVAPNYTSLAPYMVVIFLGVFLMAYIGEGGGILSYLAIGGTAFVIAYSGPGPRSDVLGSLWSVWGISVGMIIRAALTLLWREHPYRTLAEEFQAPFAAILEVVGGTEAALNLARRSAAMMRVDRSIQVMLGVANDALLEGRSTGIDPNNLIEALGTMLRLAFVLDRPDLLTIQGEQAVSPSVTNALRSRLELWLARLDAETASGVISPAPLRQMILEAVVPPLDSVAAPDELRCPSESTRTEVDRRIIRLTQMLERQLSAISLNR
jgi:hypothetical protein